MFDWFRTPKNFSIDGSSTVGAEDPISPPLVGYSADHKFFGQKTYDVTTSIPRYLWRFEETALEGELVGVRRPIEVRFTREYDIGISKETVESRFGNAFFNPATGEYEDELFGDWNLDSEVDFPNSQGVQPTTHFTLGPPTTRLAGTYELYARVFTQEQGMDYVEQGSPELAGKFDMRNLRIERIRATCPFDPLESAGEIEFDVMAYPKPSPNGVVPGGWSPVDPLDFELEARREYFLGDPVWTNSGTHSTQSPDPDGRVAQVKVAWDGVDTGGDFLSEDIRLEARVLANSPGPGNVWDKGDGVITIYHRKCPCEKHQSQVAIGSVHTMFGSGPLSRLGLTYRSLEFCRPPSSMGYGWSSWGSSRITEPAPGALVHRADNGLIKRWQDDGNGNYLPVRDDNFAEIVKDSASTDARYVVTFRDQTVQEFQADGRLKKEIDRNGNSLTYTHSGNQIISIADSKGHVLHYSYGTRTDGQPTEIRAGNPPNERVVTFEYYPSSHPTSPDRVYRITDPEGEVEEFVYDERGRLQKLIDVRPTLGNLEIEYEYALSDRLLKETIYGELEHEHDRSNSSLLYEGLTTIIGSTPLDPNGEPIEEEYRNEIFVRDAQGRIVEHHLNQNEDIGIFF